MNQNDKINLLQDIDALARETELLRFSLMANKPGHFDIHVADIKSILARIEVLTMNNSNDKQTS